MQVRQLTTKVSALMSAKSTDTQNICQIKGKLIILDVGIVGTQDISEEIVPVLAKVILLKRH